MTLVRPIQLPVSHKSKAPSWIAAASFYEVKSLFPKRDEDEPAPTPIPSEEDIAAVIEKRVAEAVAQAESELFNRLQNEANERLQQSLQSLDVLLADLSDIRRRIFISSEQELAELSICIARSILKKELALDPEFALRLAKEAVGIVSDGDEIEISVNSRDLTLVSERLEEIRRENPRAGMLLVKSNDAIEAGCMVETRLARVDATLETRLNNIAESLQTREE